MTQQQDHHDALAKAPPAGRLHPREARAAKPVPVSFSRLLCTRAMPWLAALTLYDSLCAPQPLSSSCSPEPSATSSSPIGTEAVFTLYDAIRRATSADTKSPTATTATIHAAVHSHSMADALPSKAALGFLLEASSRHAPLHGWHRAVQQALAEQPNPLASPTPSPDDTRSVPLRVLTLSSTLLNAMLQDACQAGTADAMHAALDSLCHFHEYNLLPLYTRDLLVAEGLVARLSGTPDESPVATNTTNTTTRECARQLGCAPPLQPFFTYLLSAWKRASEATNHGLPAQLDGDDSTSASTTTEADAPTRTNRTDAESEEAGAAAVRAILSAARQLETSANASDALSQTHWHWLRSASDALIALTAQLLSAWACYGQDLAHTHAPSRDVADCLYELVDVTTRTSSFERTMQVLTLVSTPWQSCPWQEDSHLRRSVVLALARSVDRAPSTLVALQTVERHWRREGGGGGGTVTCGADAVASARLLPEAVPVVRALSRRAFEGHHLWQWWRRVVLSTVFTTTRTTRTTQGDDPMSLPGPSSCESASSAMPSLPLDTSYWSALLTGAITLKSTTRDSLLLSPSARKNLDDSHVHARRVDDEALEAEVRNMVTGATLLLHQALHQPECASFLQLVCAQWFALLCLYVNQETGPAGASSSLTRSSEKPHSASTSPSSNTNTSPSANSQPTLQNAFDLLARLFDSDVIRLFPARTEQDALLAELLLALDDRRTRQTLLKAWLHPSTTSLVTVGAHAEVDARWSPRTPLPSSPSWTRAPHTAISTVATAASRALASAETHVPFLARLETILHAWICEPPHRMAEAVYLLDDLDVVTKQAALSVARPFSTLCDNVASAILAVGPPSAEASSSAPPAVTAQAWAALMASFTTTHIHRQLFGDKDHVVLFYWLLDALARERLAGLEAGGADKNAVTTPDSAGPVSRETLTRAAHGVASVVLQSPVSSVLPPMLLNWLVSPEALGMSWQAATRFMLAADARATVPGAPGTPKGAKAFLFLALPLDSIESTSHAVRVLLALHFVTEEMKAHAQHQSRPASRTRSATLAQSPVRESTLALYSRIRCVLLYTWYIRSLAAVLHYFRAHPDQLQMSTTSGAPGARLSREAGLEAALEVLEKIAVSPASLTSTTRLDAGTEKAVSTAVLCSYVLRERWVWQVARSATAPQPHETALNEPLLRDYIDLIATLHKPTLCDGSLEVSKRPGAFSALPLCDDRRLVALLYGHAKHAQHATWETHASVSTARRTAQAASRMILSSASLASAVDGEGLAERLLPAAELEALRLGMASLLGMQ